MSHAYNPYNQPGAPPNQGPPPQGSYGSSAQQQYPMNPQPQSTSPLSNLVKTVDGQGRAAPLYAQQQSYGEPRQQGYGQTSYGNHGIAGGQAFGARMRADSSNNFANGMNQNCGNFISERSSTRIHAPPGGQSSISFGNNVLNHSAHQVGGSRGTSFARSVSPVRNAGAGLVNGGQVNSSAYASMKQQPEVGTRAQGTGVYAGGIASRSSHSAPVGTGSMVGMAGGQAFGARMRAESSNNFANGMNQNCGNFITGRSSTRIHAPPGGHSQITF